MSDWDVDSIADNAWSSFDEVAWPECEGKGDHIVPDPRLLRGTSFLSGECLPKAAGESTGAVQKSSDQISQRIWKLDHPVASTKGQKFTDFEGQEVGCNVKGKASSLSKGVWCDCSPGSSFTVLPLSASSRCKTIIKSGPAVEPAKEISRFSFEGGGGMEFLAESQEEVRRDNLLEYGWGNTNNLEDMEKLFSSTDSMLSRGFDNNNDGMLWDPPSLTLGDSLESMHQPVPMPVSPQFVSSGVVKRFEGNLDFSASINTTLLSNDETGSGEEWSVQRSNITVDLENPCSPVQIDNYTEFRKENTWETQEASDGGSRDSDNMEDDASHVPQEIDKCKTSKAQRHGPRSRRLEENSRKALSQRKLALGLAQAKKSPLLYVPVVSVAMDTPPCSTLVSEVTRVSFNEPISPIQCLQPVSYVHAGFGFPAHHHLPVVIPNPVMPQQLHLQGQPIFISYQPPYIDAPKLQQSKHIHDVSTQSPTASSTMTPQEKIEKLRWRQKMQARLAVEQQQQKLINQRLIPDQTQCGGQHNHLTHPQLNSLEEDLGGSARFAHSQGAEPFFWNEKSVSLDGSMLEDGDEYLAATVLHQLLTIASKMDTRTRLCLRDGFHRLAGNAMQRRAAGETKGSKKKNSEPADRSCMAESSSSSDQSCSQRLLTVDEIVETETNPMDRFIAHLLFHKRFLPSFTPSHTNNTPGSISENSESNLLHHNALAWNDAIASSYVLPASRSSSVTGDFESSKVPSKVLDLCASDTLCEKPHDRSTTSIVSGLQLEKVLNFPASPVNMSLQHLEENESDMVDMDTVLTAVVTTSSNSFGEAKEFTASSKVNVKV